MLDPKTLTVDDLRDLLADCLSGVSGDKPQVSQSLFLKGLSVATNNEEPSYQLVRQIHAAGLLTYGDLSMVEVILDNLTPNVVASEATGYCIAAGSTVLSAMLPLPDNLLTNGRTVVNVLAVRDWFVTCRNSLYFDDDAGRFRLRAKG